MMRRTLLVLLVVLGLPLALLAALATPPVRDLVLHRLLAAAGGSVEAADGSLLGTLELQGLSLPEAGVTIAALRLRWEPAALLRGEVLVERLALEQPRLRLGDRAATEAPREAFAGFELPLVLRLEELDLRDGALLGVAGTEALRLDVTASAVARARDITIHSMDLAVRDPERGTLRALGGGALALAPTLPWSTDLRVTFAPPDGERLEVALEAEGDLSQAQAEVDLLDPWPVHATLASDDLSAGRFRAQLTVGDALAFGDVRLLRARVDAAGDPSAAELNADADFELADPLAGGHLRVTGRAGATLDAERIEFDLVATAPALELAAEGRTQLADFATAATLELSVREATRWLPERALRFEARADVSMPAPLAEAPAIAVEDLTLVGRLDEQDLALDGAARLRLGAPLGAEALDLELRLGGNRLGIHGRATDELDLDLNLDAPTLAEIGGTLTGRARLRARLAGDRSAPTLTIDGRADEIGLDELRLGMLEIDGTLGTDARQPLRLRLDADALSHPAIPQPLRLRLDANGPVAAIATQLHGELGADTLDLSMALDVDAALGTLRSRLDAMVLETATFGRWSLEAPTGLVLDRNGRSIELDASCLASGEAHLCAEPLRVLFPVDAPVDVEGLALRLDDLPFRRLARWLPAALGIDGTLSGRATLDGERQTLALTSRGAELSLRDPASVEALFSDRLTSGELALERAGDRVTGTASLRFEAAGTAELDGTLRADLAANRYDDLDLQADLAIDDLAFLGPLVPALSAPEGRVAGRLEIRGSAEDPIIEGRLDAAGEAFVPTLGRALAIRDLEVQGTARDGVRLRGVLMVDEAELTLDGSADYAEPRGLTASLAVAGHDAQVVALPDLALWVSPELEARLERDVLDIRGRLHLPRARIAVTAVPASGPTRSSDLVLHRPERAAPERPLRTR
ncbi:MAG: translocation/assembly module TamB domain-containing protein, partial [Pseudomonadales bacterium]|nr:translocation/assembly module TamB domain-containing protein [Pseudomonadales bacterium]